MKTASIERALEELRAGRMIVVVDDQDRENEGDLVCAAEVVTPEMINFMVQHGRGWICLSLTSEDCDRLELPQMVEHNTESMATAFTITIDAERQFGVTTGISAADRATTIRVAADPATGPADLRKPGHVSPLRARPGGVLRRVGHTEASVDLARLAGFRPAGVICEILADDGTMARGEVLEAFCRTHGLALVSVADLVAYRLSTEQLVHRVADARLPTEFGEFRVIGYRNDVDDREHVALVHGDVEGAREVLVRMHSRCLTGDVFHSRRCDCGVQLHRAMEL
ncbi:MAG: 3,4-dihydroxy-2-butanone-4-phosphate synthase, partial [Gemmatimonadetes bacterium]|nr:3,4-dihydroxy-2-butanone-4-phosphate synthase [Gemmatimonadota bacterium]